MWAGGVVGIVTTEIGDVSDVYQHVASDGGAGNNLLGGGNDYDVVIWKDGEIVMSSNNRNVAARTGCGCQRSIELRRCQLPDQIAAEVHVLQNGGVTVDAASAPIDQEMPVWQ